MIVRPAQALTLLSRFQPMAPGDLLLTGTPGGTALKAPPKTRREAGRAAAARNQVEAVLPAGRPRNPRYLRDGDVVTASDCLSGRAARPRHAAQHRDREDAMTTPEILLPLPASTYQLLMDAARTWPDSVATQWIPNPADYTAVRTWTYAELAGTVTRIANALTALGVRRPDAVTLSAPNTSMMYATTLAAQAVGIAAPVNPTLSDDHLAGLIRRAQSRVIVTAGPELNEQLWRRMLAVARRRRDDRCPRAPARRSPWGSASPANRRPGQPRPDRGLPGRGNRRAAIRPPGRRRPSRSRGPRRLRAHRRHHRRPEDRRAHPRQPARLRPRHR